MDGPFHPGRSGFVLVDGSPVGVLGEMHPRVAESLDVPGGIAVAELEVSLLMQLRGDDRGSRTTCRGSRRCGAISRSCSTSGSPHAAVEAAIREAGGELVATCVLFDVHSGPPLPDGKKSLAYSVDFRDPGRTLEREEADEAVARIKARVSEELGGELREGRGEARERPPV